MALKDIFKGKTKKEDIVFAPTGGTAVPLSAVKDEAFASGILGKGIAIEPVEGVIYAPADGEIAALFDTNHAIAVKSAQGAEVLIHVGIDTVTLKGEGFQTHVSMGEKVAKGQKLLDFSIDGIRAAGKEPTVIVLITNSDSYGTIRELAKGTVAAGEELLVLKK